MSKVIQEVKSTLWWIKLTNWLCEHPSLKNDVNFKAIFRAVSEFCKDEISEAIKEGNWTYKQLDEINEQLDENERELKNILGEMLEEVNLLFKKFDKDEEGENEKKLKNNIIMLIKFIQAVSQNFYGMWKERKFN